VVLSLLDMRELFPRPRAVQHADEFLEVRRVALLHSVLPTKASTTYPVGTPDRVSLMP
jgi:hypothetical protein